MSKLSVLVAWVGLAACASSTRSDLNRGPANAPVQGTYAFTANLPDQQLRGTLRVTGNDILLEPTSGSCRATESADTVAIRFLCHGSGRYEQLFIRIDRHRPVEASSWSATYRVPRTREHCSEYGVVAGQQVCVRSWTEYYDAAEGKSGKLRVRRAS